MTDRTEEEQIEAIKAWWKENGSAVIVGIIIGVGSLVGWRGWSNYQENQAMAASALYQEMLNAGQRGNNDTIEETGQQLIEKYGGTTYASLAALMLARQAVQNDDLETAEQHLRLALDKAPDPSIEHVARLRLLQVLTAREQYDSALKMINKTAPGQFAAQYEEMRGDILLAQNDAAAARQAYQKALANSRPQAAGRETLEMKLDNLGGSAAESTAAVNGASE